MRHAAFYQHGAFTVPRAIGLRADMDALPMQEETGLPYASKVAGDRPSIGAVSRSTQ
jgi:hippurate hydrolase